MRRLTTIAVFLAAFTCPALAFAQDAAVSTVDLSSLLQAMIGLAAAVLTGLAGVVGLWIKARWGMDVDFKHNAILNDALDAGAAWARAKAAQHGKVTIDNDLVRMGAQYVATGAPKAMRHFGITEARLEQMVEARLAPRAVAP